jgi:hypothetical protein
MTTKDKSGKFTKRSNAAKDMHGMSNLKNPGDYNQKMLEVTEQAMTKIGTARAARAQRALEKRINFQTDFAEVYSPSQNFISEDAASGDDYAESGRVPIDELVAMTMRVGWARRATHGKAQAIYRNGYEFVPEDFDADTKPVEQKEIKKYFDEVDWFSWRIQHLFREKQTGLGIGVFIYPGEKKKDLQKEIDFSKMTKRPDRLKAYSAWHLTPSNMLQYELGDYDKSKWDFRGGVDSTLFNHSRVTLLETKPEPFHMRGLAEIEPVWTPATCYFNTMIFVLKALAQVGVLSVGIQSPNAFPTKKEADAYVDLLNDFRANKFYLLGAGATLVTQNMASQIGKGLNDYLEFLKEDISSCLVMPKNQLFGRAEGGGLDGAGALISKDDMLAEFMAEAQDMTSEELAFLRGPCKFEKHLEGLTLRWRLDLHKSEMERLQEEAMRIDMDMKRQMADQAEKQMKMNDLLMKEQMKQVKQDPKGFLEKMNTEVEQNTESGVKNKPETSSPKGKKDMVDFMQYYKEVKFRFGGPLNPRRLDDEIE